jgi:dihydrofolate reductase
VHSVDEAIARARDGGDEEPRIIGGATLYAATLPFATKLFITEIDRALEGDTFFPAFDRADWEETDRHPAKTPGVAFVTLQRVDA